MNFTDVDGKPVTTYEYGDLYAEERRDTLTKVSFADNGPYNVTWHVTGINIVDQDLLDKTYTMTIERGEDNTPSAQITKRLEEIRASNTITKSLKLARAGKLQEAKHHLRSFKTNDPILSRVMNVAEESTSSLGGINRITSLATEVMTQRGTSDLVSTPWQRKVAEALDSDKFQ